MEMIHHGNNSGDECNGSCMIDSLSDEDKNAQDASRSNSIMLTQYHVNLTADDTSHTNLFGNPLSIETYFKSQYHPQPTSGLSEPIVPPPKLLLSV